MGLLIDHSPMGATKQDQRNAGLCDAVQLSDAGLGHGAAELADFGDFFCAEKLLEHGNAADVDGMQLIAGVVYPFKIRDYAISLVSINVVDHREIVRVRYEGECDQSVQEKRLHSPVVAQVALQVSKLGDAGANDLPVTSLKPSGADTQTIKASNASEVADFVQSFIPGNGSPFLSNSDIHVTGCPSGEADGAIKNPSRAATFGGFAFMARSSEEYKSLVRTGA